MKLSDKQLTAVLATAPTSPWLRKKALAYLFRYTGTTPIRYKQKREEENVQGTIQPDQLVVVQPGGEYHFVKDGKHEIAQPVATTETDAITAAEKRGGASYTAQTYIDTALSALIDAGAKQEDFDLIGWCDSTNRVRAYRTPEGIGEFEVDKPSWGESQPANANHALVTTGDDAYCNLLSNLRTDWFAEEDGTSGDGLIELLPQLTIDDLKKAVI